MKKNSCTPINPKKYSCNGLNKIHAKNLITKKNFCSSKIPLPPLHNFSNGPSLTSHLYFQRSMLGFPGIPGSNGIPGVPGVPGPHGPQGREGVKGQSGDKGLQGMPGPGGDRGRQGHPGKSGPRGIKGTKGQQGLLGMKGERGAVGIKGERGIMGMKGRKGDKGEKGESVKASQASVVPQTNWKQCVWKSNSDTDDGKIKVNVRIIVIFLEFHSTKQGLP